MISLEKYHRLLDEIDPIRVHGKVSEIVGLVVVGHGPVASIGEICGIFQGKENRPLPAEVVGFKNGKVLLMPLESLQGLGPGCKITSLGRKASVPVGKNSWEG